MVNRIEAGIDEFPVGKAGNPLPATPKEEPRIHGFAKEEEVVVDRVQGLARFQKEIPRQQTADIETEPIAPHLDVESQDVMDEEFPQFGVRMIEVVNVAPIADLVGQTAFWVVIIPILVVLEIDRVPRRVVENHVHDDFHAKAMGLVKQGFEVVESPEVRGNRAVIPNGIRRAHGAFPPLDPDWVDRQKLDDVDPEALQARQVFPYRLKGAPFAMIPHENLIDDGARQGFLIFHCCYLLRCFYCT